MENKTCSSCTSHLYSETEHECSTCLMPELYSKHEVDNAYTTMELLLAALDRAYSELGRYVYTTSTIDESDAYIKATVLSINKLRDKVNILLGLKEV